MQHPACTSRFVTKGATQSNDRSDTTSGSVAPNRLYREEAFARRGEREPIDGLLRVTAPHEWAILIGLLVSILALIIWGIFGQIERGISSNCLVIYPGERYTIIAESEGNVAEIMAQVGAMVEVDQPLARLRSSELDRHVRLAQSKVDLLEERSGSEDSDELALARNDLLELMTLQSAGQLVISHAAGELMSHQLSLGRALRSGDEVGVVRFHNSGRIRAVTTVSPDDARRIEPGLDARVSVASGIPQTEEILNAEVLSVSDSPVEPPTWLSALGLVRQADGHLVELALHESPANPLADGVSCSSRIVYERGSLFSVIIP